METFIHIRFIANSITLFENLDKLGFTEITKQSNFIKGIRKFSQGKKFVYSSEKYGIMLLVKIPLPKVLSDRKNIFDGLVVTYQGQSIHDELLKFFASRDIKEIKNEPV